MFQQVSTCFASSSLQNVSTGFQLFFVILDMLLIGIATIRTVWSNGKFKKVRGRPVLVSGDDKSSRCISMSLLITLPVESTVSPQIPKLAVNGIEDEENDEDEGHCSEVTGEEKLFDSFSFEDYAWRVYHERLFLKDPLVRYRI
ncbi:2-oxoglutarate (2OG) and Fe(II)-dependent oxygenase superfamily protein [Abeliophyllum distichum]|uniref:2-oxoglutarate (2OG) and Fe(II)-dependent oxygenase superfamily protein n=1 Tax=Abeliophyllum distichum TaxID=126358 RepID=A0ABD1UNR1_9LAMI